MSLSRRGAEEDHSRHLSWLISGKNVSHSTSASICAWQSFISLQAAHHAPDADLAPITVNAH